MLVQRCRVQVWVQMQVQVQVVVQVQVQVQVRACVPPHAHVCSECVRHVPMHGEGGVVCARTTT